MNKDDFQIDTYRLGAHTPTTITIVHKPTGLTETCTGHNQDAVHDTARIILYSRLIDRFEYAMKKAIEMINVGTDSPDFEADENVLNEVSELLKGAMGNSYMGQIHPMALPVELSFEDKAIKVLERIATAVEISAGIGGERSEGD